MAKIRDLNINDLKLLVSEKSRQEVCEQFHISRRTLNRVLKANGLTNFGLDRLESLQVGEIRTLYQTKEYTQTELADKYQVSQSLISKIVNNSIHRNITSFVIGGEADVKLGYKHANS